jgi:hypothetical protein
MRFNSALTVTLFAGLVCGTLDSISASVVSAFFGAAPTRVFQGIASGLLGKRAFQHSISGPLLGLGLHYFVAIGAAAVYYVASRWLPNLNRHAVISGVLNGALTRTAGEYMTPSPKDVSVANPYVVVESVVIGQPAKEQRCAC